VAYGHGIFGNIGMEVVVDEDLKALGYDAIVKVGDGGYRAQFKLPTKDFGVKEGSSFYFNLQLNNMDSGENLIVSGRQLQGGETDTASVLTLGAPIVIAVPEPEPEPQPEPEPAQPEPAQPEPAQPAPVAPAAPPTGDASIFAILGILAAAGICAAKLRARVK
jgi:hypothetical protein